MRRVFIFFLLLSMAVVLAACASVYDKGRTTNVLVTATPTGTGAIPLRPTNTAAIPLRPTNTAAIPLRPTNTAAIPLPPTFTPTPTLTPTPTRTLSPAEAIAARLPALGGWAWRADGDVVKLYDAKDQAVAVFDQKTGAIRWYNSGNQKHFAAIEPYLGANYQNRKELAKWLSDLKGQGIHFITFADSREGFPPYIVIPTADGNDVQMISSKKGTADFVYDAKAEKILGVFPDGSGYYYLNPDGSFDLAPLKEQAEKIADDLLSRGVIQHPDPAKAKFIRDATASAIMINPYGVTPREINDFIKSRTGRDFAEHFNRTWGDKVGVTYEQVMAATLAKNPKDLFAHVSYIGKVKDLRCKTTCWSTDGWNGVIEIVENDLTPGAYYPLEISLVKESHGSKGKIETWKIALRKGKTSEFSEKSFTGSSIGADIGEVISFAIQTFALNQHPNISPHINDWLLGTKR